MAKIKTACYSLMQTVHFLNLKDADQRLSHTLAWCHFVCTICMVEIGVDESIVVLIISEHVA